MPFGFSFGANKSNQNGSFNTTDNYTGNTNFNQTSTPINPGWVTGTAQNVNSGLDALTGRDPSQYVAGPNALQITAANNAGSLTGTPWNYDGATNLTAGVAGANAPHTGAVTASPYMSNYLDPYMGQVVDATAADMDHQAGLTRAQQSLDLAGSGAFGGSGAALTQSATEGELARARASTLSGLRSAGYTQALNAAEQDAQRKQGSNDLNAQLYGGQMDRTLQAAGQIASISDAYGANQRANVGTQQTSGDAMRAIQQQQAQAPLDYQAALTQLLSGEPLQLFQGQTQTGTQDESGTDNQTGTSKGKTTGMNFGFTAGK